MGTKARHRCEHVQRGEKILMCVTNLEHRSQHRSCCPLRCGSPAERLLRSGCSCEPVEKAQYVFNMRETPVNRPSVILALLTALITSNNDYNLHISM